MGCTHGRKQLRCGCCSRLRHRCGYQRRCLRGWARGWNFHRFFSGCARSNPWRQLFVPTIGGEMDRTPWIVATGQTWKLNVFYVLIALTIILQALFILSIRGVMGVVFLGEHETAALFVATSIGSLLWLALSVRCPACDARPAWTILRRERALRWLIELRQSDRCVVCGSRGLSSEENRR